MSTESRTSFLRKIRGGLIGAGVLIGLDVVLYGSFLISLFVTPIWFIVSIVKAVRRRADWRLSVARAAIPALTLLLVLVNATAQSLMARANARKIIAACNQYKSVNGEYPATLAMLVPKYLDSIPRAKYAIDGRFMYLVPRREFAPNYTRITHTLMWVDVPPFGRRLFDFEAGQWGNLD